MRRARGGHRVRGRSDGGCRCRCRCRRRRRFGCGRGGGGRWMQQCSPQIEQQLRPLGGRCATGQPPVGDQMIGWERTLGRGVPRQRGRLRPGGRRGGRLHQGTDGDDGDRSDRHECNAGPHGTSLRRARGGAFLCSVLAGSGLRIRSPDGEREGIVRPGFTPQGVRPVLVTPRIASWVHHSFLDGHTSGSLFDGQAARWPRDTPADRYAVLAVLLPFTEESRCADGSGTSPLNRIGIDLV